MKFIKIHVLMILLFIGVAVVQAPAAVSFTGESGIQTSFEGSPRTDKLGMNINGFLAGQLGLMENLFLRAGISIKTSDIFETGIFKDTKSSLALDELSINYEKYSTTNRLHLFSVFAGNIDPIGTDRFLKHLFGANKITSPLMESFTGTDGLQIFPLYGIGGSYVFRLRTRPVAVGFYVYGNRENEEETVQPNIDFRFAIVHKNFTMDIATGVGFPFPKKETNDEKIFLSSDKIFSDFGLTLLIGNTDSHSFFIQTGYTHVEFSSFKDVFSDDLFFFFEPRLKVKFGGVNISLFNLPPNLLHGTSDKTDESSQYRKLLYLEDSMGLNVTVYADIFHIANKDIFFGMHSMFAFNESNFSDWKSPKELMEKKNLQFTPFVSTNFLNGEVSASLQVRVFKFVDDPKRAVRFSAGYKKTL